MNLLQDELELNFFISNSVKRIIMSHKHADFMSAHYKLPLFVHQPVAIIALLYFIFYFE